MLRSVTSAFMRVFDALCGALHRVRDTATYDLCKIKFSSISRKL
jgi:hypothetical protein